MVLVVVNPIQQLNLSMIYERSLGVDRVRWILEYCYSTMVLAFFVKFYHYYRYQGSNAWRKIQAETSTLAGSCYT